MHLLHIVLSRAIAVADGAVQVLLCAIIPALADFAALRIRLAGDIQRFIEAPQRTVIRRIAGVDRHADREGLAVVGSAVGARRLGLALGNNIHCNAALGDIAAGIFGSQRVIVHAPFRCDSEVKILAVLARIAPLVIGQCAICICLGGANIRGRLSIKQESDGGIGGKLRAADTERRADSARWSLSNSVGAWSRFVEGNHRLWGRCLGPGEEIRGSAATAQNHHNDDSQNRNHRSAPFWLRRGSDGWRRAKAPIHLAAGIAACRCPIAALWLAGWIGWRWRWRREAALWLAALVAARPGSVAALWLAAGIVPGGLGVERTPHCRRVADCPLRIVISG